MPPWSAVRADVQTKGRGRFGRSFASGPGGLWLSAVMPTEGPSEQWAGFSLRAGASLLAYLKQNLGLAEARLRWPNDLMCGTRKLAGLLIEQPASGMLIVGFGMNVTNQPWLEDPALEHTATRLADWITPPDLFSLTEGILDTLADAHREMLRGGMQAAIEELNTGWQEPMPVEIILSNGKTTSGAFLGLDSSGNLLLLDAAGTVSEIPHPHVERLRELGQ
jgi:BirA family biotin operon repressor/biotin-[acetyl-CoA-carboxylase] ligase